MNEPVVTSSPDGSDDPSRRGCLVYIPLAGGILLILVAIGLILFLGLRQVFFQEEPEETIPLEVTKSTPVTAVASPIPSVSPLPTPACETVVSSGDTQVTISLPVSITLNNRMFPIMAINAPLQGERWTYPPAYPGAAAWICGTVVNYVVGLESTPENEETLVNLRPGDEIKMRRSNGAVLFFRFTERREAEPDDGRVFAQGRPRLTLVLLREEGNWQVATAEYVSESEPVQPASNSTAQLGQPVRVGDAQVTAVQGHVERGDESLLPGTMYYLVEYTIENVGLDPLNTTKFNMLLQDGAGNEYLISPAASAAGEYGPLSGQINPGATVQGSAGYVVPETLQGPTLIWTFSPDPGSELRISVSIPYQQQPETTPGAPTIQAEVTVTDAFLNSTGDLLIIEGEIRNTGNGPLTVETDDVKLTSSAGMSARRSAAPPFPWTIEPGERQLIELQYERPEAATALLSLLGYSFEIRGLP